MTLRIGFDMDGVLADLGASVERETQLAFAHATVSDNADDAAPKPADADGSAAEQAAVNEVRHLTSSQRRQLWKRIELIDNFWESLSETEPGIVARLWSLSQERRWEVIFLTKRPKTLGATVQLQSHLWLQRHGFLSPSVFVVQGSRGKIAAALDLDLVVDDTPDNCVDVLAESRAKAILIARQPDVRIGPSAKRLGIGVVCSVTDCLNILADANARASERPYFVERLMQLLGIKRPPPRIDTRPLADF